MCFSAAEPKAVLTAAEAFFVAARSGSSGRRRSGRRCAGIPLVCRSRERKLLREEFPWALPVASLQAFLDDYVTAHPETKIDYIHGLDSLKKLSAEAGNMGFYLPDPAKGDLFRGVILDGVLPRKTFSMGEAREKRYYMEAKKIEK